MAIYLDEDMVGADPDTIAYPHLLLCMGVTVLMSNGSLIGAHVSDSSTEALVLAELANQIGALPALAMNRLYCTGDYNVHRHHGGLTVQQKAAAIGFHGTAYLFDTGDIDPQDGTFVMVTQNGPNHKCSIDYKRDEKVRNLYQFGVGPNVTKPVGPTPMYPAGRLLTVPANTTGLSGAIHKLHRASPLLQMKSFNIP